MSDELEAEWERYQAECGAILAAELQARMDAEADARDWVTVDEVAAERRCNRKTIYDRIHRGEIPFERIGRSIRLRRGDVDRAFEGRPKGHRKPLDSAPVVRRSRALSGGCAAIARERRAEMRRGL